MRFPRQIKDRINERLAYVAFRVRNSVLDRIYNRVDTRGYVFNRVDARVGERLLIRIVSDLASQIER